MIIKSSFLQYENADEKLTTKQLRTIRTNLKTKFAEFENCLNFNVNNRKLLTTS